MSAAADPFGSLLGAHRGVGLPDGAQLALAHPGPAARDSLEALLSRAAAGQFEQPLVVLRRYERLIATRPLLAELYRQVTARLQMEAVADWEQHCDRLLRASGALPEHATRLVGVDVDIDPMLPGSRRELHITKHPLPPPSEHDDDIELLTACGIEFSLQEATRVPRGSWKNPEPELRVCAGCRGLDRGVADCQQPLTQWSVSGGHYTLQRAVEAAVDGQLHPSQPGSAEQLAADARANVRNFVLEAAARDVAETRSYALTAALGDDGLRGIEPLAPALSHPGFWAPPLDELFGPLPERLDNAERRRRGEAFKAAVRAAV